uniref:histone deacetylase n=1 Tax=Preussia minima TaxID=93984 RepID=A0A286M9P0_9PLEO|nr:histone deacetylase HdaA [Preussia minima]
MDQEDFDMEEEEVVTTTEVNGTSHVNEVARPTFGPNGQGQPFAGPPFLGPPFANKDKNRPPETYEISEASQESRSSSELHGSHPHVESDDDMDITYPSRTMKKVEVRVPPPPRFQPLPYTSSKTGLVYDARMRFHSEPMINEHANDIHPEDPRRIHEIFREIQEAGLVQSPEEESEEEAKNDQCWRIQARFATREEICQIHTNAHYEFVKSLQSK